MGDFENDLPSFPPAQESPEEWKQMLKESRRGAELEPRTLEIAYIRENDVEEDLQSEVVFEDPTDNTRRPRLLVSLESVLALKALCEKEHHRFDELSATLNECRSAYYKEIRYLREQLKFYSNKPDNVQLSAVDDDFEVYWFDPPRYLDPDLKEFLLEVIRQNIDKLLQLNRELRSKVAFGEFLEKGDYKEILRTMLRKGAMPGTLVRHIRSLLHSPDMISDFQKAIDEFAKTDQKVQEVKPTAPAVAEPIVDAEKEMQLLELKQKEEKARQELARMEQKFRDAMSKLDAEQLERKRLEDELAKLRAETKMLQDASGQRSSGPQDSSSEVAFLRAELKSAQAKYKELDMMIKNKMAGMVTEVGKTSTNFQGMSTNFKGALNHMQRRMTTFGPANDFPSVSEGSDPPKTLALSQSPESLQSLEVGETSTQIGEESEEVASLPPPSMAKRQSVVEVGNDLMKRVTVHMGCVDDVVELLNNLRLDMQKLTEEHEELQRRHAETENERDEMSRRLKEAEALLGQKRDSVHPVQTVDSGGSNKEELERLKAEMEALKDKLAQVTLERDELKLSEQMLQTKLAMTLSKLKEANREIKRLKGQKGADNDSDDDELQEELDLLDFMIPYAVRVLAAGPGKKRFQLLMEESKYIRKRMDYRRTEAKKKYMSELEVAGSRVVALQKMAVSDALSFLSGVSDGLEPGPSQVTVAPVLKSLHDGPVSAPMGIVQKALPSTTATLQQMRDTKESAQWEARQLPVGSKQSLIVRQVTACIDKKDEPFEVATQPWPEGSRPMSSQEPRPRSRSPERAGGYAQHKAQGTPAMRGNKSTSSLAPLLVHSHDGSRPGSSSADLFVGSAAPVSGTGAYDTPNQPPRAVPSSTSSLGWGGSKHNSPDDANWVSLWSADAPNAQPAMNFSMQRDRATSQKSGTGRTGNLAPLMRTPEALAPGDAAAGGPLAVSLGASAHKQIRSPTPSTRAPTADSPQTQSQIVSSLTDESLLAFGNMSSDSMMVRPATSETTRSRMSPPSRAGTPLRPQTSEDSRGRSLPVNRSLEKTTGPLSGPAALGFPAEGHRSHLPSSGSKAAKPRMPTEVVRADHKVQGADHKVQGSLERVGTAPTIRVDTTAQSNLERAGTAPNPGPRTKPTRKEAPRAPPNQQHAKMRSDDPPPAPKLGQLVDRGSMARSPDIGMDRSQNRVQQGRMQSPDSKSTSRSHSHSPEPQMLRSQDSTSAGPSDERSRLLMTSDERSRGLSRSASLVGMPSPLTGKLANQRSVGCLPLTGARHGIEKLRSVEDGFIAEVMAPLPKGRVRRQARPTWLTV